MMTLLFFGGLQLYTESFVITHIARFRQNLGLKLNRDAETVTSLEITSICCSKNHNLSKKVTCWWRSMQIVSSNYFLNSEKSQLRRVWAKKNALNQNLQMLNMKRIRIKLYNLSIYEFGRFFEWNYLFYQDSYWELFSRCSEHLQNFQLITVRTSKNVPKICVAFSRNLEKWITTMCILHNYYAYDKEIFICTEAQTTLTGLQKVQPYC